MEKRKRRPNWTEAEKAKLVDILTSDIDLSKGILRAGGKYKNNADMSNAWEAAAAEVSSINKGIAMRSGEEAKTNLIDLKSRVKQKKADMLMKRSQTGGGEKDYDDLTIIEQKVLLLIGKQATEGIPGGIDTSLPEGEAEDVEAAEIEEIKYLYMCSSEKDVPPPRKKDKKMSFEEQVLTQYKLINENLVEMNSNLQKICEELVRIGRNNLSGLTI